MIYISAIFCNVTAKFSLNKFSKIGIKAPGMDRTKFNLQKLFCLFHMLVYIFAMLTQTSFL